jgi:hypothetical protein
VGKRRLGAIAGLVAAATCAPASAAEPSRTRDARREVVLRVDEVERAVSLALVHNPAFQVRRVGWRLFIVGTAANPYEALRVRDVAERYAGMVEMIVELCRCPR